MRYFAEWLALKGVVSHLRGGSLDAAYARTRRLARVGRSVLRDHWRWSLRNLELVFGPDLAPGPRRRLAEIAFEQHLFSYMERIRQDEVAAEFEGLGRLREALAAGRGAVGATLHLGCWEAGLRRLADRGLATSAVHRPASNPRSERVFAAAREEPSWEWIAKKDVRGMWRALERGRLLCVLVDVNMTREGIPVPFLGVPAMTTSGPARLALRRGAPVVPLVAVRTGPGRARVHVGAALDPAASAAAQDPAAHLMARVHAALEPWIVAHAEQYNWLHPRWRTRPGGGAWTLADPIESLWAARVAPFPTVPERVRELIEATAAAP